MYLYNRDFASPENKMWYDLSDSYSIEGGDVLVLSRDIVAVGLSQRTTVSGAENFARNLLQNSGFKKVLAFDIPETRAFMHLDTVFTMVDYDKFTIHPEIEGPLSVYEMTLDDHHVYKVRDLNRLRELLDKFPGAVIVTTEKDAVKLTNRAKIPEEIQRGIYYLPINISFIEDSATDFLQKLEEDVRGN